MESKYTPISLISLKKVLTEHFNDFNELKVWGNNTTSFQLMKDSNLPVALAFNNWPRLKVILNTSMDLKDKKFLCRLDIANKKYICIIDRIDEVNREVCFSENIYRSELRDEERLICYPHRNVFLYTSCPKLDNDNLLQFRSPQSDEVKKQLELKRKFVKRSDKLEEGDLIGMRVFDLSSTGVSIVVSKEELELLEFFIDEMTFKLSFLGEYYQLLLVKLIHSNHLILPGVRDSKLFKVGLSYQQDEKILKKNEELIDCSITLEELEREFTK